MATLQSAVRPVGTAAHNSWLVHECEAVQGAWCGLNDSHGLLRLIAESTSGQLVSGTCKMAYQLTSASVLSSVPGCWGRALSSQALECIAVVTMTPTSCCCCTCRDDTMFPAQPLCNSICLLCTELLPLQYISEQRHSLQFALPAPHEP